MLLGKYLKKYYKKYAWCFILGILILAAVDYANLIIPELMGQMVDAFKPGYIKEEVIQTVTTISLEVLGISAAMFLGRFSFRVFLFRASTGIGQDLRQEMFEKAERLDKAYYHSTKIGNVMSWMTSDTEEIMEYFGWGTVMLVDGVFMTAIVIVKMFILDWRMSILTLIPIILIIVWGLLVERVMAKLWFNRQKSFDDLYDHCEENFSGIRVIKAFIKETQQLIRFSKIAKKNKEADIKLGVFSVMFDNIVEILIELVITSITALCGYFIYCTVKGDSSMLFGLPFEITPAKLVTFTNYFLVLVWPLIALGSVITMHSRAKTSYKRIESFLDVEEVIKDKEGVKELENVKGKIEFRHLNFAFPDGEGSRIHDLSFTINPGENIGIVGRVGSGKTTLSFLMTRLYNVEDGTLFIDDNDVMNCSVRSVRENVALVPQDNFLFSGTVKDNIAFGANEPSDEEIKDAAIFSDVEKDIEGFRNKYDTETGERGLSLSGGQKQRISISRAFIKNAPIMIFDDSVSAVDMSTEDTILNNIKKQRAGKTTIIIASRISTVNKLDRILVLNEGRLEAFDTPENLLKISPTYKKMDFLQKAEEELKEGN